MIHSETIVKVGSVDLVEEDGFMWAHITVTTAGKVNKIIRIPHYTACYLGSSIQDGMGALEGETRKNSWAASIAYIKRWARR